MKDMKTLANIYESQRQAIFNALGNQEASLERSRQLLKRIEKLQEKVQKLKGKK